MTGRRLIVVATVPGVLAFWASAASGIAFPGSVVALFWFTLVITAGCAALAVYLLNTARRTNLPELGVLAAGLFAVSTLPMVHAITLPGVIYEANSTTMIGAWGGLPLGLLIALPTLFPRAPLARRVLQSWRLYANSAVLVTLGICILLLAYPTAFPAPTPLTWWTLLGAAVGLIGAFKLGLRQATLYDVGQRRSSIVAAVGFCYVALSSLVWLTGNPLGLASWLAHGFDGVGVLLAAGGLWMAHRSDIEVAEVFAPVLNREPIMALRLGVSPQVMAFLQDLGEKDAQTRGHVVRVAELAMKLGESSGLSGTRLRNLGLGAILHDIGKIRVPDAVLKKTGTLTNGEYEQMKLHTVWGDEMLRGDSDLAAVAQLVRSHHERPDGSGYPDRLGAHEIPAEVSIISVCDAWDAMVQDRHYRNGMDASKARTILCEFSGTQWDPASVNLLIEVIGDGWQHLGAFDELGDRTVCSGAIPEVVRSRQDLFTDDRTINESRPPSNDPSGDGSPVHNQ